MEKLSVRTRSSGSWVMLNMRTLCTRMANM
ncbi:unnamed protein product, partial [Vitis vinifera]